MRKYNVTCVLCGVLVYRGEATKAGKQAAPPEPPAIQDSSLVLRIPSSSDSAPGSEEDKVWMRYCCAPCLSTSRSACQRASKVVTGCC